MNAPRKVLLVGWDSADWRVINPLLDAGKLPYLKQLIVGGVSGNMATLYPALSPMLWTSIATGKRPHKHGICGFTEPDPDLGGVRPITNLSRKTKTVWNILSQNDKKCIVIGWWPSHPAEPLPHGVMVSNSYQKAAPFDSIESWPITKGTVYPESLGEILASQRVHPSKVDDSYLSHFMPKAAKNDKEKDRRPVTLRKILGDSVNIHSAARYLIANRAWDFMAVYYDAIDHFGHSFMCYHPPRQSWISKKDFELYGGVIEAAYRHHDLMLGELLTAADSDTTVLLMSDHGFHPDKLRPIAIPIEPAGPAVEHRHYGIFVLKGPGIKQGEFVQGANVLDVCPTLLSLFGLPSGQDMDGKPLVTSWVNTPKTETIPSWDTILGADGTHPPSTRLDPTDSREALRQLEALGYIEPLPENTREAEDKANRELRYNLACSYVDAQMPGTAAEIFAALWKECPKEHRYGAQLFTCQLSLGLHIEARSTFLRLEENRQRYSAEARKELKKRRMEWKDCGSEELKLKERTELDRLSGRAKLSPVPMQQMKAMLLMAEGKPEAALPILEKLKKAKYISPSFYIHLALGYFALKEWDNAEKAYKKTLDWDCDNGHAHFGLAQVYLATRRNYDAADSALSSIGLLYNNPSAHFVLGVALHRLGKIEEAIGALSVCLTQNTNFLPAYHRLAQIYENRLKNSTKAAKYRAKFRAGMARRRAQRGRGLTQTTTIVDNLPASSRIGNSGRPGSQAEKPNFDPATLSPARTDAAFVTIVSGLPRSGTSLMMQMLAAGGLPALKDGHRAADQDNPRGYFEFAPAKNIRRDTSWMPYAPGRCLKLVAQLLPFLPPSQDYRIILMERSIEEVLTSQKMMLDRNGRRGAAMSWNKLRVVYEEQLAHITSELAKLKLPLLRVLHHEAINKPKHAAKQVRGFLGLPLNVTRMAAVVDPSLYRHRSLKQTTT
jgi:predicted AlkP superfamily phosphohydrolase/phosphomutase/predicted Zn-dependent protease